MILGLNPGGAVLDFQSRAGIFANEIREAGSFSAWAASHPYLGPTWTRVHGRNRYGWARLNVVWGINPTATLTGYAYETVANKPITAGAESGEDARVNASAEFSTPVRVSASLGHLAQGAAALNAWRRKTSVRL